MKKLLILSALIAISCLAQGQTNQEIKAMMADYKLFDTIKIDDFIRLSEITLNDKSLTVVSFTMSYEDSGFNVSEDSNSNKITDKMKKIPYNIKDKELKFTKLYIEKIKAKNSGGEEVNVPPLIFYLRIK